MYFYNFDLSRDNMGIPISVYDQFRICLELCRSPEAFDDFLTQIILWMTYVILEKF